MHQELTNFLCIMDARIRKASNLSSGSESLAEKDLLTLILESRQEHLGYMDDEEIKVWYLYCVYLHIQLTACVNVCMIEQLLRIFHGGTQSAHMYTCIGCLPYCYQSSKVPKAA